MRTQQRRTKRADIAYQQEKALMSCARKCEYVLSVKPASVAALLNARRDDAVRLQRQRYGGARTNGLYKTPRHNSALECHARQRAGGDAR